MGKMFGDYIVSAERRLYTKCLLFVNNRQILHTPCTPRPPAPGSSRRSSAPRGRQPSAPPPTRQNPLDGPEVAEEVLRQGVPDAGDRGDQALLLLFRHPVGLLAAGVGGAAPSLLLAPGDGGDHLDRLLIVGRRDDGEAQVFTLRPDFRALGHRRRMGRSSPRHPGGCGGSSRTFTNRKQIVYDL